MKKDHLKVSEQFYSFQGEGITSGKPAYFLRLTSCNLLCRWCDTIPVWKKGTTLSFEDINKRFGKSYLEDLDDNVSLIITGGEPLLQQERLEDYLAYLINDIGISFENEVETNGTIIPSDDMLWFVSHWNVSPKLSNSHEERDDRINRSALSKFKRASSATFKFVIKDLADWEEIERDYLPTIDRESIILMPEATDEHMLKARLKLVAEIAKQQRVRFTTRLQVDIFNELTGV